MLFVEVKNRLKITGVANEESTDKGDGQNLSHFVPVFHLEIAMKCDGLYRYDLA